MTTHAFEKRIHFSNAWWVYEKHLKIKKHTHKIYQMIKESIHK